MRRPSVQRTAGNPVLTRLIDQTDPVVHPMLYRKFSNLLGGEITIDHHEQLLACCAAGEADKASQLSADYWRHLGLISELFEARAFAS